MKCCYFFNRNIIRPYNEVLRVLISKGLKKGSNTLLPSGTTSARFQGNQGSLEGQSTVSALGFGDLGFRLRAWNIADSRRGSGAVVIPHGFRWDLYLAGKRFEMKNHKGAIFRNLLHWCKSCTSLYPLQLNSLKPEGPTCPADLPGKCCP